MVEPLKIDLDFDGDFRQVVLKLANTYTIDNMDLPNNFTTLPEMVDIVTSTIAQDFAHQLQPLLAQKLMDKIDQQLP